MATRITATPASRAASRIGYATHKDRVTKPLIRAKITDPWREVTLGRGDQLRGERVQAHPGEVRQGFGRRHHLVPLHERRDLSSCRSSFARRSAPTTSIPARASAIRPTGYGLKTPSASRPARRRSTRSCSRTCIMRHRREPDRRPSGVRLADEAAACARARSSSSSIRARSASCGRRTSRRTITCAAPGHERRHHQRAAHVSSPKGSRGALHRRALRADVVREVEGVRRRTSATRRKP